MIVVGSKEFFENGDASPLFRIPQLVFTGSRRRRHPIYGEQWMLYFESPCAIEQAQQSACEVAYNSTRLDFECELETGGPVHRLTVITPDEPSGAAGDAVTPVYELNSNEQQKDLREHPKALALGPEVIRDVDALIEQALQENIEVSPENQNAVPLYNLLLQGKGSRAFDASQYVFRYTRVTSSRSTISVGYSNTLKIYSTAQMITETGPPKGVLASIADAYSTSAPAAVSGYQYGWLKKKPNVQSIAGNKVQITGEYWLDQWSTWVYDRAP
jgi:hypothetical protein